MKNILSLKNALFLLTICCIFLQSVHAANTVPKDAQIFWTGFRTAVLNDDQDKIVANTNFPFKTRGDLDSDPEREYNEVEFLKLYKTIFNQFDRRYQKTVKKVIEEKELLLPKNLHGSKKIRIENLVFRKQADDNWLFTFAYVSEDDVKKLFSK
ncbi:MAG: hypothetical protein QM487_05785 [Candidatus Marithrix sp.]